MPLDRNRPPKPRPGFTWVYREGCSCKSCPWKGNCQGETWEHWMQVRDEHMIGRSAGDAIKYTRESEKLAQKP